jgi:hypothetical protein
VNDLNQVHVNLLKKNVNAIRNNAEVTLQAGKKVDLEVNIYETKDVIIPPN